MSTSFQTPAENLSGRTALVTGAASGIGRACARQLAACGAAVGLVDRDLEGLKTLHSELERANRLALVVEADVTDYGAVADAVGNIASTFTGLDIAVNAAGIEGPLGALEKLDPEAFHGLIAVNVLGLYHCLRAELATMSTLGCGSIINVSSIYGLHGQPRFGLYAATKHAVAGLTKAAALENATRGIRVNAVAPGPIETPLLERVTDGDPQRVVRNIPMRRLGTSDEVASAVVWLAGDSASFVTGHILCVDGGMSAQAANTPDPI